MGEPGCAAGPSDPPISVLFPLITGLTSVWLHATFLYGWWGSRLGFPKLVPRALHQRSHLLSPPEFINEFIPHVSICHNIKTLVGPRTVCGCEGLCSPFRVCIISHELNSSSLLPFFKVPHSALIN